MRTIRTTAALGATALAAAAGTALALPASADGHVAMLSVLHGVPDTTVDVYVNGELTLDDFEPGDLAGPLELEPDTYSVAITAADAEDDSDPVIGPVDLPLEGGMNYTAAAHLDAEGSPTATLFTNDTSEIAAGEGRLTVRHVAAAPAVDVLAGGDPVIEGLENPDEQVLDLPAGTVSAAVAAAGTTDPVIGPADVDVAEGTNTIVYAWGSLENDSLALATQTVEGMHSAPDGVDAGTTGAAAADHHGFFTPFTVGTIMTLLAGFVIAIAVREGVRAHRARR
ncbi:MULTISPECIES: DUF4397 domain-containing protein [unclassified Isoptericola]|uniref:DUF4397 domain-containing protein n=1 Tax=unclassified Isoptericola TaxID=2623355 RepID=UPI00271365D5|nr:MULTISPECIES: DUF4397 domain-containing protein [unclassified Isoptericola]MDO8145092.1 DUF4397 domain-containing protein [Isoptericola sp. 178]MDO8151328.1 DUF4397 domain-containing protein [Isoptericola sp. b408]